ncbi:hypothetical protein KDL44_02975 [bacterium]|nr:hypothetical protein [bacterium]
MQKINIIIAAFVLAILASCSGQTGSELMPERNTAEVNSIIDVWNAYAPQYNFGPAYSQETLGQIYFGNDFESDMNSMEQILADFYGKSADDVNGESTMGFVHFDDEVVD